MLSAPRPTLDAEWDPLRTEQVISALRRSAKDTEFSATPYLDQSDNSQSAAAQAKTIADALECGGFELASKLLDSAMGNVVNLMRDEDASRVLQSAMKEVHFSQLTQMISEIADDLPALASHPRAHCIVVDLVNAVKHPLQVRTLLSALMPHANSLWRHPRDRGMCETLSNGRIGARSTQSWQ
eukprot:TRINITY_DN2429_c0_g1_i1.p1 TRINITY_DN2429_c0_g1~~TRINITY_DN2429_c0_g1_i1.p1  ORF type:complete len:200 (-),score=32.21 TRINITY_DN2429_c0_g1_i1:170-718(-)